MKFHESMVDSQCFDTTKEAACQNEKNTTSQRSKVTSLR